MMQTSLFDDYSTVGNGGPDVPGFRPIVDLHRHLLGAVSPEIFFTVAKEHSLPIPADSLHTLDGLLTHRTPVAGLREYFKPWRLLSGLLRSPESLRTLVISVMKEAAVEGVRYVELRASWGMTGREQYPVSEFLGAVEDGLNRARGEFGVHGRLIFGITRHVFGRFPAQRRQSLWRAILDDVEQHRDAVVGVDLSGVEDGFPAVNFLTECEMARERGLGVTIHSGETERAQEVIDTVRYIRPERIGHGLSAVENAEALELLSTTNTTVEVCPTSNWLVGAVSDLGHHPALRLQEHGIPIAICTDNPGICRTSLPLEHSLLYEKAKTTVAQLVHWQRCAANAAFCNQDLKTKLIREIEERNDGE